MLATVRPMTGERSSGTCGDVWKLRMYSSVVAGDALRDSAPSAAHATTRPMAGPAARSQIGWSARGSASQSSVAFLSRTTTRPTTTPVPAANTRIWWVR
jgi:hypothetical protein